MSLARQHRITHEAAAAAKAAEGQASMEGATAYELMMAQLTEHRRQLKAIQSVEAKIARKRELLPEYLDYVAGVLQARSGVQDDVLMTVMTWCLDTADWSTGLQIAEYALAAGLSTPEHFKRDTATVVAEEVAEAALKQGADVPPEVIATAGDMTAAHDMPDEVRAKLHKALGLSIKAASPTTALVHLQRALELNDKSGVKKEIEQLERQIRKDQAQQ